MIEGKQKRAIIKSLIEEKFGEAVTREINIEEYEGLQEYYDTIAESEKTIEVIKPVEVSERLEIIEGKKNTVERNGICGQCGKQEVFFSGKDTFYVIKYGVCEKCYSNKR